MSDHIVGAYFKEIRFLLKVVIEFAKSSKKRISTGKDGVVRILSPVSAAKIHALEAHGAKVSTEDANHKFLRSLPPAWSNLAKTMRTKPDVDTLSIDDLYNNLRVFEQELTSTSKSSASAQNVTFVSHNKSSTNKVKTRSYCQRFADEVIYSLFAKQSEDLDLLHEDLEQIDDVDIEKMDINWQIAMIAIQMKKFYKKTRRRVRIDGNKPVGFEKKKLECFKCHNTGHFARECTSNGTNDGKKRDSFYQDQGARKKEQNQNCLLTMDDGVVNWGEQTVEEEETNHALMEISSNNESLLSGGDNQPPMLVKHLYDSWKSRMELYMLNRPHGRMILTSVEKGPLVWPSITEDGVTRLKEYVKLTPAEAIQADCDIKAINIILQGLPTKIYALVSQHHVAKDLWEKIKLLMQGTSLTKQEQECKLYDEFDKFTYKKEESLHECYLSKFVTDVKLVKDLHTTNVDQLHAYLEQHERHANEVRLMHERNSDPLALVASHQLTQSAYQSHLHTYPNSQPQHHVSPYPSSQFVTPYQTQQFITSQSTPLSITYPSNEYQSSVQHNVYSPQSSIPQLEYAPTTYQHQQSEFSQPDSGLIVLVFQKGDDPIDAINHMIHVILNCCCHIPVSYYQHSAKDLSNPRNKLPSMMGKVPIETCFRETNYLAAKNTDNIHT
ncbi:retrovirus-related pol polyprotein from transposon TNT 1-94 [Tanacetum coccineum]